MKEEAYLKVANRSRHQALNYLRRGNSGRAYAHFLVALKLCPTWKSDLKEQFISTLYDWCETLSGQEHYNDICTCYESAMELFPENPDIVNSLGSYLYRWGYIREAFNYFHHALMRDPLCLTARRNLQGTSNLLLERWHFRMLNDRVRNEAFQEAISKRIFQLRNNSSPYVLDIGTGTGLLSLFALAAGARHVFACDYSETMIKIATKVLESNSSSEGISLINKRSTELIIPTDVPKRVSLVVTEIVDAGLFGEGILQTLSDAWERLLAPEGKVIPQSCTLWIAPVECDYITNKYQLKQPKEQKFVFLDVQKLNLLTELEEPYDTEDLDAVPGGFRLLAEPCSAFGIDFCNPGKITAWLENGHKVKHKLCCTRPGKLQAMVAWFDLHLDDDITISSAPTDHCNHGNFLIQKAKCWDQAVFPEKTPILVTAKTVLDVTLTCLDGKLSIETCIDHPFENGLFNIRNQEKTNLGESLDHTLSLASSSISASEINEKFTKHMHKEIQLNESNENYSEYKNHTNSASQCCSLERSESLKLQSDVQQVIISQEGIRFLNNSLWMQHLEETAVHFCKQVNSTDSSHMLDLSPLPMLGMFLLTRMSPSAKLIYTANEEAVKIIANFNGINEAQLKFVAEDQLFETIVTKEMKFDVIITHLLDQTGELRERVFSALPILKDSLAENGLFLPQHLAIIGQLIKSDWLAHVSRIEDSASTCGYRIAPFINVYQGSHHLDLNITTLPAIQLCEPKQLLLLKPVEVGPICCDVNMKTMQSGEANALVYWFEMQYLPSCNSLSTFHQGSFMNQAAILFSPNINVVHGFDVKLHLKFEQGFFHIISA